MCFKGQACQQSPHRGDRDGICRLMRHHSGSRAPSAAFGGDGGVVRTTAGTGDDG